MSKPAAVKRNTFALALADNTTGDLQASSLVLQHEREDENIAFMRNVYASYGDISEEIIVRTAEVRGRVNKAFSEAIAQHISVGTQLNSLKRILPVEAWRRFFEADGMFAFSASLASKLMIVADAVNNRFPEVLGTTIEVSNLPAITTCYELTTLENHQIKTIHADGLITPNLTKKQIDDIKLKIKTEKGVEESSLTETIKLIRKETAKEQRLDKELIATRARLTTLNERRARQEADARKR